MSQTKVGLVETVKPRFAYLRDDGWQRWFFYASDCESGALPEQFALVEFWVGQDARGPRATRIRVIAGPAPAINRLCVLCRAPFGIEAGAQVWFAWRRLALPVRCPECRRRLKDMRKRAWTLKMAEAVDRVEINGGKGVPVP
jgi:hypothetical protein